MQSGWEEETAVLLEIQGTRLGESFQLRNGCHHIERYALNNVLYTFELGYGVALGLDLEFYLCGKSGAMAR